MKKKAEEDVAKKLNRRNIDVYLLVQPMKKCCAVNIWIVQKQQHTDRTEYRQIVDSLVT